MYKENMMDSKIAVVIDSTTLIPEGILENLPIRSAPAIIIWEGEELRDGVDIQPRQFYTRLQKAKEMPTTSQASPHSFKKIFTELHAKGHEILAVTVSSKLSGMHESAVKAKEMLNEAKIEVVDSLSGTMTIGLSLQKMYSAIKAGASLQKGKQVLENALKNTGVLFTVDTLEFLHRGGRIGGAQRFLATAFRFKPILEVVNGRFEGVERVRTRKKSLERLVDLTIERIAGRKPVYIAAMHANAKEVAEELIEKVNQRMETARSFVSEVSPGVGVHLGPGTVGLAYLAGVE
jgi:DegV family protein with EDD domain